MEVKRLEEEGCNKWWNHLLYNRLITFNIGHILYLSFIYAVFGLKATLFHIMYSLAVTLMLEAINYLEHYGLEPKLLPGSSDVYESVKITHSWNAPQVLTNYILFKLQRHSDHHANSYKPYQILDSFTDSPILPYGYSVSILLCMFPPIWSRVTDPIAIATNKGEKVSEEYMQKQQSLVLMTLCTTSVFLTYITFFVIGFK